jgi:hypothetical protein
MIMAVSVSTVINTGRRTREDLNTRVGSVLRSFTVDRNIERKDNGVLWGAVQHGTGTHDGALVNRSDFESEDGNLHLLQESQESLQRTKSTGLDEYTATGLVDEVGQTGDILHREVLELFLVVIRATDVELGTGNGLLEARRRDLDTKSGLDFFVVHVRGLAVSSL